MMLQCSTRVPQKPSQDHENDSNKGKVATSSSVGDDCPSRGSLPFPIAGRSKGQQGLWTDHWLGGLLHNPEEQGKGRQALGGGRVWGRVVRVAANTR